VIDNPHMRRVADTVLPTQWGMFRLAAFQRSVSGGIDGTQTAVVLILGDLAHRDPLLRIHSQCLTGDVLKSLRCDCGAQLELAMDAIAKDGCGLLIYEHQEGRGIGLIAKLQAYALQDQGLDTIAANHALGFAADCRDFGLPAEILKALGVPRVRLLSNNPEKMQALVNSGIDVVERIPCEVPPNPHALGYLQIKKERMGHTLTLV
jgi:GTP cyclohydrolase II